jgi:hypothetical protein
MGIASWGNHLDPPGKRCFLVVKILLLEVRSRNKTVQQEQILPTILAWMLSVCQEKSIKHLLSARVIWNYYRQVNVGGGKD